ncbi:MAG TPA: branched-chain amino acid ABC transporter substrate-binding protein [Rhodocyclaceae bacterium]|nr:branched-chain amino acid ABC transporter substrate-binding protein [Rhodocyclaceae bacterium]
MRTKTLLVSLSAALALMACSKNEPAAPSASAPAAEQGPLVLKLGHSAPLTGPQAHIGKDTEYGAQMAVDDVNAANIQINGRTLTVELMGEDDQADPKQGTIVAQKFVDAHVNAVIGHMNSGTTLPASVTYANNNLPQVSASATNPEYTKRGYKTAFRVMTNDEAQGKVLGEFAAGTLAAKDIAVIDDKTQYGEGIAIEFKKAAEAKGAKIVASEHTDDKAVDFAAILTKIKATKPDVIFFGGMDPQAAPMSLQMKKLGIKAVLLMGDGGCTADFLKNAGASAEGQYCSKPGVPTEQMPGGPAFIEKYKAKYNAPIQLYAPYAYDAVMVVVEAVKRAGSTDSAAILAELPKTQYKGVTTDIAFDEKGDIKDAAVTLYLAKGGQWTQVETVGGKAASAAAALPAEASPTQAAPAAN